MESISDTIWDVVICGTGLQQSLLALALSRSGKKILHIDPNDYYGGAEASLSLQEADAWADRYGAAAAPVAGSDGPSPSVSAQPFFSTASVARPEESKDDSAAAEKQPRLAASRSYALALAPQILHSRSALVNLLVSSQAYRQLDFLAVSSFFVVEGAAASSSPVPSLVRIPATREDVFASTALGPREKRKLMKFLKFVLTHGGDEDADPSVPDEGSGSKSTAEWQLKAAAPFGGFLQSEFGLDDRMRDYVLALTLSLDGASTTVADGLSRLYQHITSMGVFGPGFAAVYPKWGGCSEISQVACRAGAVGGAVYMLGAGVRKVSQEEEGEGAEAHDKLVNIELTTDVCVKAKLVVGGDEELPSGSLGDLPPVAISPISPISSESSDTKRLSRLVAVVGAPLPFLYSPPVEGAPVAGGAVIAIPAGQPLLAGGLTPEHPVFVMAHSSDTGECPPGQSVIYFTTVHSDNAKAVLDRSLETLLVVFANQNSPAAPVMPPSHQPPCLYKMYYEQISCGGVPKSQQPEESAERSPLRQGPVCRFPPMPADLIIPDASLDAVRVAWTRVMGCRDSCENTIRGNSDECSCSSSYMVFEDREGRDQDDDAYD